LKGTLTLEDSSQTNFSSAPVSFGYDRWVEVGFSCMQGTSVLWLDGVPVAEQTLPLSFADDTSGGMDIVEGGVGGFEGYIDEVRISRWGTLGERALSRHMTIDELEARLSDADPDNDYLDVVFTPEGMLAGEGDAGYILRYSPPHGEQKSLKIQIGYTGNIYRESL